jgi:hypothetical protein
MRRSIISTKAWLREEEWSIDSKVCVFIKSFEYIRKVAKFEDEFELNKKAEIKKI